MKFQSCFLTIFLAFFLISCGAKKSVVRSKRKQDVFVEKEDPALKKTPSVGQEKLIKKLKKESKSLNKYTLAYIKKYAPIAVVKMFEYKIPASITLAQGILESGNGRSTLARKSNNHFGIKCHSDWRGKRVYYDDDKDDECFRKYKYVSSSYNDHSLFLTQRKRYAFLFHYKITDYKRWAKGLKKAGYATDRRYANKLIDFIKTYKLYEFDKIKARDLKKYKKLATQVVEPVHEKIYIVEKGDTLYSIAKKFNLTVKALKKANKLSDNTIHIGQHLVVE